MRTLIAVGLLTGFGISSVAQTLTPVAEIAHPNAKVLLGPVMKADGIDRAADLAVKNPYWNPRPIDRAGIRALIENAFHGRAPQG